jgi:hypothetical protein
MGQQNAGLSAVSSYFHSTVHLAGLQKYVTVIEVLNIK